MAEDPNKAEMNRLELQRIPEACAAFCASTDLESSALAPFPSRRGIGDYEARPIRQQMAVML